MGNAFSGSKGLEKATLPEGVKTIGSGAFADCSFLKEVLIPTKLDSVAEDAFKGCSSLTAIVYAGAVFKDAQEFIDTVNGGSDGDTDTDDDTDADSDADADADTDADADSDADTDADSDADADTDADSDADADADSDADADADSDADAAAADFPSNPNLGKVNEIWAVASDGSATVTWSSVEGAEGYCLFKYDGKKFQTFRYSEIPSNFFTGLKNGTKYQFAAAAFTRDNGIEYFGKFSDIITVIPQNDTLKISDSFIVLHKGNKHQLHCLLYDEPQSVVWNSSNEAVASVSEDGLVTAKEGGEAVITAADGEKSLECTVCVDRKAPAPRVDTASRYTLGEDGIYYNGGNSRKASIKFVGDLMALHNHMSAAKQDDGYYDFFPSFIRVEPLLQKADLVIGNLETTLSESFPYSADLEFYMGISNCNTVSSYLDALKTSHFDMLVTANNHYCDSGPQGIIETLNHLDQYNFMHIGTYRNASENRVIVADVNGIKIGFLNYNNKTTNGKSAMFTEEEQKNMLGKYYRSRVENDIKAARRSEPSF